MELPIGISDELVKTCVQFCQYAYVRNGDFKCLLEYELVKIINNPDDLRFFIAKKDERLLVSVRGSETLSDFGVVARLMPSKDDLFKVMHTGVKWYGDRFLDFLENYLKEQTINEIVFTGHSLGAGAASYLAAKNRAYLPKSIEVKCVTFASVPFATILDPYPEGFPFVAFVLNNDIVQYLYILQHIFDVFYYIFGLPEGIKLDFSTFCIPGEYKITSPAQRVSNEPVSVSSEKLAHALNEMKDNPAVTEEKINNIMLDIIDGMKITREDFEIDEIPRKKLPPSNSHSTLASDRLGGSLSFITNHCINTYAKYFGLPSQG